MAVREFELNGSTEGYDTPLRNHALAAPHRRRLVAALREADAPLDTERLTGVVGLHPNTVRWHLGVLENAGIVERRPLASEGRKRGRPRLGFALVDQSSSHDEYRLLAAILASSLAGADDGPALAREAGRSWGGRLVDEVAPGRDGGTAESLGRLVRLLRRHGFRPELTTDGIALHACPYGDIVLEHRSIVCAAHQGIVEAALTRMRVPLRVAELVPQARQGTCTVRLAPTPPSA